MRPTGPTRGAAKVLRAMVDAPLHRMVVPGASGVSTARDMARFYAAIAAGGALDGARILRSETVVRMLHVEVDGEIDATFAVPVRRGLGFELGDWPTRGGTGPVPRAPSAPSGTVGSAPPSAGPMRTVNSQWPSSPTGSGATKPVPLRDATSPTRCARRFANWLHMCIPKFHVPGGGPGCQAHAGACSSTSRYLHKSSPWTSGPSQWFEAQDEPVWMERGEVVLTDPRDPARERLVCHGR